jgi:hypothetical protein
MSCNCPDCQEKKKKEKAEEDERKEVFEEVFRMLSAAAQYLEGKEYGMEASLMNQIALSMQMLSEASIGKFEVATFIMKGVGDRMRSILLELQIGRAIREAASGLVGSIGVAAIPSSLGRILAGSGLMGGKDPQELLDILARMPKNDETKH